jgi:hypothetical protein
MAWLEAANSRDTMSKQQRYDVGKEFGKTTGKRQQNVTASQL